MKRHSRAFPCPICEGHVELPQGKGVRCAGYTSDDEKWARCTREQFAGSLPLDSKTNPPAYVHSLTGDCRCGERHTNTPSPNGHRPSRTPQPVAIYEYRDIAGNLVGIKARFHGVDSEGHRTKTFKWKLPGSEQWDGLKGKPMTEMPLWGAELLSDAIANRQRVWFVEGEEAAKALRARNEVAVCGPWGAGQKDFGHAFESLRGAARIILFPDNDAPGREYMAAVLRHLKRQEISRMILTVTPALPPKGDAVDYFQLPGTSVDRLLDGTLAEPTVDLLEYGDIRVRIPSADGIVSFTFEDITRSRGSIEAELSVSMPGFEDPWEQRINVLSPSARESLTRQLNSHFAERGSKEWTSRVNTAFAKMRQAVRDTRRAKVELLSGEEQPNGPAYVIRPYLLADGLSLLYGLPGGGKSTTAMLWAVSMDANVSKIWNVQRPCRVLWVNMERPKSEYQALLARVNRILGLAGERGLLTIHAKQEAGIADIVYDIRNAIRELDVQYVFLDSISRTGVGDLKEDQAANKVMNILNGFGVGSCAIGHSSWQSDEHIFGSVMFNAAADVAIQTVGKPQDAGLGVSLKVTKANHSRTGQVDHWLFGFDDNGVVEVRRADEDEREGLPPVVLTQADRIANELAKGKQTASQLAETLGIEPKRIRQVLTSKAGHKRFQPLEFTGGTGERFYGLKEPFARSLAPNSLSEQMSEQQDGAHPAPSIGGEQTSKREQMASSEEPCSRCRRKIGEQVYAGEDGGLLCVSCYALEEDAG